MKDLTKGNITSILLLFAIPIACSRICQLFYTIADTRIVGSALGDHALAAISASSTFYQLLLTFVTGMASGFAIVAARHFGAGDKAAFRQAAAGTFALGCLITLLLTVVSLLTLPFILKFLKISGSLLPDSTAYIRLVLLGLIFAAFYNLCAGVLYAIGDSVTPLLFLFVSAVINVGLDLLFVYHLDFGVRGAAWGTILSQAISSVTCFAYMWIRYPLLRLERQNFSLERKMILDLLQTGFSCGLMQSMIALGSLTLQTAINSFGSAIIVAHTAARRISEILMMPFVTLANACGTFVSQNLGAGEIQRIRTGIRRSIYLLWIWCGIVLLISYTLSPTLVQLITATHQQKVIQTAALYLRVNTIFYFLLPLIIVIRQSLQSLGDRIMPIISSGIECVGKIIIAFTLAAKIGYWGIILSEPIVWFVMVIPLLISLRRIPILKTSAHSKEIR